MCWDRTWNAVQISFKGILIPLDIAYVLWEVFSIQYTHYIYQCCVNSIWKNNIMFQLWIQLPHYSWHDSQMSFIVYNSIVAREEFGFRKLEQRSTQKSWSIGQLEWIIRACARIKAQVIWSISLPWIKVTRSTLDVIFTLPFWTKKKKKTIKHASRHLYSMKRNRLCYLRPY